MTLCAVATPPAFYHLAPSGTLDIRLNTVAINIIPIGQIMVMLLKAHDAHSDAAGTVIPGCDVQVLMPADDVQALWYPVSYPPFFR